MQQFALATKYAKQLANNGRPDLPAAALKPGFYFKKADPSSTPRGDKYPVPSFFRDRENDAQPNYKL
ncbi:MAG: hypothetical protein NVS9B7_22450 [Flavisolibacter sp.]